MNIYLVKASAGSDYSKYKTETGGPPQNIFAAAAATPKWYGIGIVDETIGMKADSSPDADLVVIFMSTPDAYRAYELASHYRQQGKWVVLGGLHTKFNPEEAADGTIRKLFAKSIGENSAHGSDSDENAALEISQFFSEADIVG